jgi:hypothetical protein
MIMAGCQAGSAATSPLDEGEDLTLALTPEETRRPDEPAGLQVTEIFAGGCCSLRSGRDWPGRRPRAALRTVSACGRKYVIGSWLRWKSDGGWIGDLRP